MTGARAADPMPFSLAEARELLARTPALLDTWLRGLPEAWLRANEGGESWSPIVRDLPAVLSVEVQVLP